MTINFNKKIYKKSSIYQAIKDFGSFGDFRIKENKKYYIVSIKKIDPDFKDSFKEEFCNYILSFNF